MTGYVKAWLYFTFCATIIVLGIDVTLGSILRLVNASLGGPSNVARLIAVLICWFGSFTACAYLLRHVVSCYIVFGGAAQNLAVGDYMVASGRLVIYSSMGIALVGGFAWCVGIFIAFTIGLDAPNTRVLSIALAGAVGIASSFYFFRHFVNHYVVQKLLVNSDLAPSIPVNGANGIAG